MKRGRLTLTVVGVVIAAAVVGSAPALASGPPVQNLWPTNGATVPYGFNLAQSPLQYTCPRYMTSYHSTVSWSSYYVEVATQPDLGPDGTLATAYEVTFVGSYPTNAAETECRTSSGSQTLSPGTYYWQAQRTDCDEPNCTYAGPVSSFTVAQPQAPDTAFLRTPAKRTRKHTARFAFASDMQSAGFQCQYANGWSNCQSPISFHRLLPGRYRFAVRAVANGLADPSPAKWSWKVRR